MSERLTLRPGQWYGLTMWPGYGDGPYHSPILVREVRVRGQRRFTLLFVNAAYAGGVQETGYELETLVRSGRYLLAKLPEGDRSIALVPLNSAWFDAHMPGMEAETYLPLADWQVLGGRPAEADIRCVRRNGD